MKYKHSINILEVQISEPWDFEVPAGGNKLKAKFVKVMSDKDRKYLLLKTIKSFEWKNKKIDYLIVQARYQGESVEDIFSKKTRELIVGIDRLINLECLKKETFQISDVDYFAIGSIALIDAKKTQGKK